MENNNLGTLFVGAITVVLFALSIGQYSKLESFAKYEAAKPLKGLKHYTFFPKNYDVMKHLKKID